MLVGNFASSILDCHWNPDSSAALFTEIRGGETGPGHMPPVIISPGEWRKTGGGVALCETHRPLHGSNVCALNEKELESFQETLSSQE